GTKTTGGAASRGRTASRGTSQGGRAGTSQDRRSGTGQDRRAGAPQSRRTSAPQDKRAGAPQDKRAGAPQDRRAGDGQDRRAGYAGDRRAADRGTRRTGPGQAGDGSREASPRQGTSSPSGSRPFSRAPRRAADGESRGDGWAPAERRGPAVRSGDQSRRSGGPR